MIGRAGSLAHDPHGRFLRRQMVIDRGHVAREVGLAVGGVILGIYLLNSRKSAGPDAGTIERGRKEPTGTVRKGSGDAETANERIGQA